MPTHTRHTTPPADERMVLPQQSEIKGMYYANGPAKVLPLSERPLIGLFAASILIWAPDFKASASGAAAGFQSILLLSYLIVSFCVFGFAIARGINFKSQSILIIASATFMIDASVIGIVAGQPLYAIFVNLIPAFIYVSAAGMTHVVLVTARTRLPSFLNALRLGCIAFGITHILIIMLLHGAIDVSTSRYEVLSGAVIASLGVIAVGFTSRLTKADLFIVAFTLVVTLLSVTRTLLVVFAAQVGAVIIARPSLIFRPAMFKGLAIFCFSVAMIIGFDYAAGTGLANRWVQRLTVFQKVGADPTALARSAETHFMLQSFATSPRTIFFGNGLAARTSLTGPDAARAARIVGWQSMDFHSIGYGHENFVSILFISGLLGGGGLLVMQFLNGLQSIAFIRQSQLEKSLDSTEQEDWCRVGTWGAIIVIGMIAAGFLGGTLDDRASCLWYGVGTGMLYWSRCARPSPTYTLNGSTSRQ